MSDQYWKNKNAGVCYICRERPIREGHCTCTVCAADQCLKQQARVAKARAAGNCTKCFSRPKLATNVLCQRCYNRTKGIKTDAPVPIQQDFFAPPANEPPTRTTTNDPLTLLHRQLG